MKERFFIDAYVNFYFFLERLYAGGKFRTADVVRNFGASAELGEAYRRLHTKQHSNALKKGIPLIGKPEEFFQWIVNRRGFFQHQSETDPNRWLHSTQEAYADDAIVMADFATAVYFIRNADRVFNQKIDDRYQTAALEARANMKIVVTILGDNPDGKSIRHQIIVDGPGTRTTREMARDVLFKSMQVTEERLISVRQITAIVQGTHELLFSYTGPGDMPFDQQ
ncbi:MAG: hypothetical protein AB7S93_27395 [Xanthobacteraceae bacterium]